MKRKLMKVENIKLVVYVTPNFMMSIASSSKDVLVWKSPLQDIFKILQEVWVIK